MKKLQSFNNTTELTKEESNIIEEKIYNYFKINNDIPEEELDMNSLLKRNKYKFLEKDYNRPQTLFFIKVDSNITIFGRKMISELYIKNLIPSKNCSLISKNMIVGILSNYRKENRDIQIEYYPLTDGEKNMCLIS